MCHLNSKVKLHFLTATDAIWKACNVIKQICNKAKNQATGNYSSHQKTRLEISCLQANYTHMCNFHFTFLGHIFSLKVRSTRVIFWLKIFLGLENGFYL